MVAFGLAGCEHVTPPEADAIDFGTRFFTSEGPVTITHAGTPKHS